MRDEEIYLPFAEDINYWKTGTSAPDTWIDKAIRQIETLGGEILRHGFGSDVSIGRAAYMLEFVIDRTTYKAIWPVLPTKGNDNRAARRQAATMLYHDVKARCISATVLGARTAFFAYMILPSGGTAATSSSKQLAAAMPSMFGSMHPALPNPEPYCEITEMTSDDVQPT
jgi:hypothetical protein